MKKLIALFLTLTLMLTCLLGIALADSVPQIGNLTIDDDGTVTLKVTGEEARYGYIYFQTPEGEWAGSAYVYPDEKTGLLTGSYNDYSSYPDAVVSTYEIYGKSTSEEQYSKDQKTRTYTYTDTSYNYNADGILTRVWTNTQETVGEQTEWTYKPSWADEAYDYSDYATTSYKTRTETKDYTAGEPTNTTTSTESYKVKLIKTPENTWLDSFSPYGYEDYELISAERSETEKGTTESGEEIKITRVADLAKTFAATEKTSSDSDRKYISWQEDEVTGSVQETRKGTETYSWSNTETQIDETTVTIYGDNGTKTKNRIRNNKNYDKETNELTGVEKENTKTDLKYTTVHYTRTDSDGKTYTEENSGYAVTAFSGTVTSEEYENNELASTSEREYDLIVKLRDGETWIPSDYYGYQYYYDILKGKETETRKDKDEWSSTRAENDSKEESVYYIDNTRMTSRTEDRNYYNKETGKLTQSETSKSQSEYQFEEYSYLSNGETQKGRDWRAKKEHREVQRTEYTSDGKRTSDSNEDISYEFDYVEEKNNDGTYSHYNQRTSSYVNDATSHSYYTDTQEIASETVSHDQWSIAPGGTSRTGQYTSNTQNYSASGEHTGWSTTETTETREKGENGSVWSDGWDVTDSVTNTKEYNRNDVLTYEYTATENKNTANSTSVRRSGTGKMTETQSSMTDKKNGTSSSVNTRYNTYTSQPTYEYTRTGKKDKEGSWKYTTQYTYNNDDGSLRRRIVNNADGSVIRYNNSNQVVARKDAEGMWTDGAGNKIGLDRDVDISFKQRTGEIEGYGVSASSGNEYTYTWYEDGKVTYEEKTIHKEDGTEEYYEDGVLRWIEKDNTTKYYDVKGNLTSSSKYDPEKDETSEFDSEGKLTRTYDDHGNETRYDKAGKVLYSQKEEYSEKDDVYYTVYSDGEGKEFARLYSKSKSENKDDGTDHWETTTVRIAGEHYYGEYGDEYTEYEWWDPETATGKLEKEVRVRDSKDDTDPVTHEHFYTTTSTSDYTKWTVIDGEKTAEVTRSERNETRSGDGYYESRTYRDGVLTSEYRSEDGKDGTTSKGVNKVYDARTGKQTFAYKGYYESETPFTRSKTYDRYENLQRYGITDNTDEWSWGKEYYANGTQAQESWSDGLDNDSDYFADYYLNGNKAYERSRNEDSSRWIWYHEDGSYGTWSETNDGITTTWQYDEKGNLTGIRRNEHYEDGVSSYEQWDAEKLLYTVTSGNKNGKFTETYQDPEGNTLVYSDGDYTLTPAVAGDGWKAAFGDWFYLENGALVRNTWKQFGGDWYYFDHTGRMMTGVVTDYSGDSSTVYAMGKDGTLSDGGWTETANGWTYTSADGVVTTGWQQIDGKWYYFNDGWYFNESEYQAESEWVQSSYRGIMQTGATKIWNSDWQTQHTYFFNEDGTWDNSPGWKSTNGYDNEVEYHYYDENGTEVTGWKNIGGKWYYFNEDGVMKNGWVGAGSTWYYMEPATGEMATGWVQEKFEDDWFHMDANGVMQTGWQQIDGTWYYFKDDGTMAASEWVGSYYMDASGKMSTGWVKDNGKWYYLNAGGVMQTGWQQIDGSWYYFKDNGVMAADELVTGAFNYYMGADGRMCTGWVKGNGKWYHMNSNGIMDTGWLEDGGSWYFLYTEGGIATGQVTIGDKVCIFDANGVWLGYAD